MEIEIKLLLVGCLIMLIGVLLSLFFPLKKKNKNRIKALTYQEIIKQELHNDGYKLIYCDNCKELLFYRDTDKNVICPTCGIIEIE